MCESSRCLTEASSAPPQCPDLGRSHRRDRHLHIADLLGRLDNLINQNTVIGGRYTEKMQSQVGTEDFEAAYSDLR